MSDPGAAASGYDVFLSYGTPDREWVRGLKAELEKLGLKVFQDERDLKPGDNWVLGLSGAMLHSRSMALVLSAETLHRKWVEPEWTSFLAAHGATSGRLVPILLEDVTLPPYLNAIQAINARDLDTPRVARELVALVGRRGALPEGDVRKLYFGQDLVFVLEPKDDAVTINDSTGRPPRTHPAPWRGEARFTVARIEFARLTRESVGDDRSRAELHGHAATLGGLLFDLLFDAKALELLRAATIPGQPRPLVTIRSDDDLVLSLPWELLHHDGRFLVRDGDLDLVRSIPRPVGPGAFLQPPAGKFALVVNVSAPEGSGLDYEAESYRLTRALTDHCELTPTELGTLDDLVRTVAAKKPAGIHFSGHGGPGVLSFEDDEGRARPVAVDELVSELKKNDPEGLLPPFFYLANCHGNDPAALKEGRPGVESLAARLHREGVAQVVAYAGPILDVLSTEAEATLYAEIAAGQTTRFAVRRAREAMTQRLGLGPPGLPRGDVRRRGPGGAGVAPAGLVAACPVPSRGRPPPEPARSARRAAAGGGRAPAHVPRRRHPADPDDRLHRPPHRAAPPAPPAPRGPARVRAPGPRRPGQVDAGAAHGPRPAPRRRRPLRPLVPGRREGRDLREDRRGPRRPALGVWPQTVRLRLGRSRPAGGPARGRRPCPAV